MATEREELQHLFSSLTKAAPKRQFIRSRKNCFVPKARFSSHKYKGSFPFPILESQCKKNDFIPKRVVHLFSFRKGNAENFSERLKYFLQSRACLMGWPGDRPAFYMFTRCTFPPPNPLPLSSIYHPSLHTCKYTAFHIIIILFIIYTFDSQLYTWYFSTWRDIESQGNIDQTHGRIDKNHQEIDEHHREINKQHGKIKN